MTNAITQVREQLTAMQPEIARVLPSHVTLERFERVTLTALQRQPDLLGTDRKSLFAAVMQCAQDGLQPDGKEAALVKFKNSAAYMPMVAGLLKLARQSGEIASLTANVVYAGDDFDYWIDDQGEHLNHRPSIDGDRATIRAVYAMARTSAGESIIEVMPHAEVEKVRKASRSGNAGPWRDWYSEMARKTAIRRLFKRLPRSTDRLDEAVHRDDQFYSFSRERSVDASEMPTAAGSLEALTDDKPDTGEAVTEAESTQEKEATSETQPTQASDSADSNAEIW